MQMVVMDSEGSVEQWRRWFFIALICVRVCICAQAVVRIWMCGFSPSTRRILGIELRSSGLMAVPLPTIPFVGLRGGCFSHTESISRIKIFAMLCGTLYRSGNISVKQWRGHRTNMWGTTDMRGSTCRETHLSVTLHTFQCSQECSVLHSGDTQLMGH